MRPPFKCRHSHVCTGPFSLSHAVAAKLVDPSLAIYLRRKQSVSRISLKITDTIHFTIMCPSRFVQGQTQPYPGGKVNCSNKAHRGCGRGSTSDMPCLGADHDAFTEESPVLPAAPLGRKACPPCWHYGTGHGAERHWSNADDKGIPVSHPNLNF